MRVIIYARISRDRAGANVGVARQQEECEAYAEQRGWNVVAVLSDNDISAYSGKVRPGYRSLLELIERRETDAVLCWHTDRLHRSPMELEGYIQLCDPLNVATFSTRAGLLDLSTPAGRMIARQLGAVARYESELRSERVQSAKQKKAALGGWSGGGRPFGWEQDGITPRIYEVEALVTGTYDALQGETMSGLARAWNAAGVRTSVGNEWIPQAVRDVLLRPRNAGLRQHKGEVFGKAQWEPVVPPDIWHALRRMLTDPERKVSPGNEPKYLGSQRYRCGATLPDGERCNAVMKVFRSGPANRRNQVYICTRRPKLGVDHVTIKREEMDEYVVEKLINGMLEQGATTSDGVVMNNDASDEVRRIEEAQRALGEEMTAGRMPANVWQAMNAQLAEQHEKALAAEAESTSSVTARSFLGDFELDPYGTWEALSVPQKRALMDQYVTVTVMPLEKRGRWYSDVASRVQFDWKFGAGE